MQKSKIILGIETSFDETGVAILKRENGQDGVIILSNILASSYDIHIKYGGVVPEQAAREQIKLIIPVIKEALRQAQCKPEDLDAIAVTYGPGLIGSLLVGVETAKTLALLWNKPLIPVNHLLAHFYAAWISNPELTAGDGEESSCRRARSEYLERGRTARNGAGRTRQKLPTFPSIGLLVSGGHTDLILMTGHGKYKYLGGTRDDAAGECFDKCARLLGLPYPGGPSLSNLAKQGTAGTYKLPKPMHSSKDLDFSFSGLKTAVSLLYERLKREGRLNEQTINNLAADIEDTITNHLAEKTILAAQINNIDQIIISGGVAANQTLQRKFNEAFAQIFPQKTSREKAYIPQPFLCTDNGAIVAACAFYNYYPIDSLELQADPSISLQTSELVFRKTKI